MARKRVRRNISTTLTDERADNLKVEAITKLLSGIPGRKELFDSDLQRRAVYMANENRLIDEMVAEYGPGSRPSAYWEYSEQLPDGMNYLKYLIDNDLLLDGELEEIKAEFYEKLNGPCPQGWEQYLKPVAEGIGGELLQAWNKYEG